MLGKKTCIVYRVSLITCILHGGFGRGEEGEKGSGKKFLFLTPTYEKQLSLEPAWQNIEKLGMQLKQQQQQQKWNF